MKEIEEYYLSSTNDFMTEVIPLLGHNRYALYRGQSYSECALIPKLLRNLLAESEFDTWAELEASVLLKFKTRAQQDLNFEPHSELEWHALAAHFGLASRMTAWSSNPLVGLFFACLSNPEAEGAVYRIVPMDNQMFIAQDFEQIPESPRFYTPRHSNPQLQAQRTHFLSHPMPEQGTPAISLEDQYKSGEGNFHLARFTIEAAYKKDILAQLSILGIDATSLFGGLSSIASQINSEVSSHTDSYDWIGVQE